MKVYFVNVSKFLILFTMLVFLSKAFAGYPDHSDDYVNDFANIIQDEDKRLLHDKLSRLERTTGIEGVVVTINSVSEYSTSDQNLRKFATNLFNTWGVGHKQKNNGFLIIVSVKDRESRIELGDGYGNFFNNKMDDIMRNIMVPRFKNGEYSRGVYDGTLQVTDTITRKVSWFEYHKWHICFGVLALIMALIGISLIKKGKTGWGYALLAASATILVFVFSKLGGVNKSKGGFGGGRSSGGGGSSGNW